MRVTIGAKLLLAFGTAVLLTLFAPACTSPPEPVLRIGTNVWPGYEPLYLARREDYLGPGYRLVEYSSATQVIRAYRNQVIDAAFLTLDEALRLAADRHSSRIVLVADYSNGADVILGRGAVTALEQLPGKRVGVENTAVGAYVLTRALERAGLDPGAVHIVPVEHNRHVEAFLDGELDAVVTFEPARSTLLATGANLLFDSSKIPNEILDVLIVRESVIREQGKQVQGLVKSWFEALRFLEQHPGEAHTLMARREGVSPAVIEQALAGLAFPDARENRHLLAGDPPHVIKHLQQVQRVMLDHGLLSRPVDIEQLPYGDAVETLVE